MHVGLFYTNIRLFNTNICLFWHGYRSLLHEHVCLVVHIGLFYKDADVNVAIVKVWRLLHEYMYE